MINVTIIIFAALLLIGLLYFEKKGNRKGLLPTKTALSLLFIIAVLVQPHLTPRYYHLLLLGLIFCLLGDVCLALPQQKMFLLGLVSFLIGHIFYVFGFFSVTHTTAWTWAGSLVVLLVSGTVYGWLRPHLGEMNIPVVIYIIVISIMISGACSLLGNAHLAQSGRVMAFVGAVSFYFSDVFVARDRFLKKEFLNRLIGLPMYYAGQFLLAFSVGLLGSLPSS
ncbi:MAG: hypothetical protein AMK69_06930 [Nitrospira bacterium SG8_3]|nr:MAG: hypothetical protein AMK69_06930 [Nitrospira bacterium SG8_3]